MANQGHTAVFEDPWPRRKACKHDCVVHYGHGFLLCHLCGARGLGDRDDGLEPRWEDGKEGGL